MFNNTQNMNNDNEASQILKICRLNITLLQKIKSVINSKTYFFLLASNQTDKNITTEKVLEERKGVHLI